MIRSNQSTARKTPAELEVIRLRAERGIPAPIPGQLTPPAPAARYGATRYEQQQTARFGVTPGVISSDQDTAALDHAARAYQAAHPGTNYIDAVKAVQYQG